MKKIESVFEAFITRLEKERAQGAAGGKRKIGGAIFSVKDKLVALARQRNQEIKGEERV